MKGTNTISCYQAASILAQAKNLNPLIAKTLLSARLLAAIWGVQKPDFFFFKGKKIVETKYQKLALNSLMGLVFLQFILGVLTLLLQVPVWLGVAHQVGAFFLLTAMTFTLHRISK